MAHNLTTHNSNNRYSISIAIDATGGDFIPTTSGYEESYTLVLVPDTIGAGVIAADLKIDGIGFITSPVVPLIPSIHGVPSVGGAASLQAYILPGSSLTNASNVDSVEIYEVYLEDNGVTEWHYKLGPQPSITVNLDPIKIYIDVKLTVGFTGVIPTSDTQISFDFDLDEITSIYGCTDSLSFNYDPLANTDDQTCYPFIYGCTDSTADNFITLVGNNFIDVNTDDSSCQFWGCIDPLATAQTGGGIYDCSGTSGGTDTSCCGYGTDCNTQYHATTGYLAWNYVSGSISDCLGVFGGSDDSCCTYVIPDCTDTNAISSFEYVTDNNGGSYDCLGNDINDSSYTQQAGWDICCNYITQSCTDPLADNYASSGTHDCNGDDINDSSYAQLTGWDSCCTYAITGCTDFSTNSSTSYTHPVSGTVFNISWINPDITGVCGTIIQAPQTTLNGVTACWGNANNPGYLYEDINLLATVQNTGDCVLGGCMDDGNLVSPTNGGTDPYDSPDPGVAAFNYDSLATYDDGSCIYFGCMDATATTYVDFATADSILTLDSDILAALEEPHTAIPPPTYDPLNSIVGDCGSGGYSLGCTDSNASNYDSLATLDDGSCCIDGCMDELGDFLTSSGDPYDSPYAGVGADNYDATATCDDGTYCTYTTVGGCMDSDADNYDSLATVDDGSCLYDACTDVTTMQKDNTTLAVTNSQLDCNSNDRSGALTGVEPNCDSVITYNPITQNYYACEYECPIIGIFSPGFLDLPFDTTPMPWYENANSIIRKFHVTVEYGFGAFNFNVYSNGVVTKRKYSFIVTEDNTSSGEWSLNLGNGTNGFTILDLNGNTAVGVSVTNSCVNCDEDFNDPLNLTGFPTTVGDIQFTRQIKPFIAASTGGGSTGIYKYYDDDTSCYQHAILGTQGYTAGCTDSNATNYNPLAHIDDGSCLPPCDCCNEGDPAVSPTTSNYAANISFDDTDPCYPMIVVVYSNNDPACGNACPLPSRFYMAVTGDFNGVADTVTSSVAVSFPLAGGYLANTTRMIRVYEGSSGLPSGPLNNITSFPFTVEYQLIAGATLNGVSKALNSASFGNNVMLNNPETGYDIAGKTYRPGIRKGSCLIPEINAPHLNASSPDFDGMTDLLVSPTYSVVYGCTNSNKINYNILAQCPDGSCLSCYYDFVQNMEMQVMPFGSTSSHKSMRAEFYLPAYVSNAIGIRMRIYKGRLDGVPPQSNPGQTGNWIQYIMPQKVNIVTNITGQSSPCVGDIDTTINWVPTYNSGTYPFEEEVMEFELYNAANCPNLSNGVLSAFFKAIIDTNLFDQSPLATVCETSITGTGNFDIVLGCTDSGAVNTNENCAGNTVAASVDDGCCIATIYGCTSSCAINYFAGSNVDDGSCLYVGCVDQAADDRVGGYFFTDINGYCTDAVFVYDPLTYDCTNPDASYTSPGTLSGGSTNGPGLGIPGATHECDQGKGYIMNNFDPVAMIDNGSCDCGDNPTGIYLNAYTPGTFCECVVSGGFIGVGLPNAGSSNGC